MISFIIEGAVAFIIGRGVGVLILITLEDRGLEHID